VPTICVLHPGAMGARVAGQARQAGATVRWAGEGRSAATVQRAGEAGLEDAGSLATALDGTDLVLSICPPEFAEAVSDAVAAEGFAGTYVEANAISPRRMARIAGRQLEAGATVVDGAIIGSPPHGRSRPRLYLAGDPAAARRVADCFAGTLVQAHVLDQPIGGASALKMAYGGYQKAARALAATSQALARAHGVHDELLAEGRGLSAAILGDTAHLSDAAAKAWRWAPEMEEVADALREVSLPPQFALAAAATMRLWENDKDQESIPPATVLDHLRTDR
jgi:3-hydroxyisobutyrate dehydrogenase-like beta-hydroxyacid dehydrogenase